MKAIVLLVIAILLEFGAAIETRYFAFNETGYLPCVHDTNSTVLLVRWFKKTAQGETLVALWYPLDGDSINTENYSIDKKNLALIINGTREENEGDLYCYVVYLRAPVSTHYVRLVLADEDPNLPFTTASRAPFSTQTTEVTSKTTGSEGRPGLIIGLTLLGVVVVGGVLVAVAAGLKLSKTARAECSRSKKPVYVAESYSATRQTDEELLGFDEDLETDGPSTIAPQRLLLNDCSSTIAPLPQKEHYDIYLLASSNETPYFRKMMNIIHNNRWSVQTSFDHEPGVLLYEIVTDAISHCSHVVGIITKEDCDDVSNKFVFDVALRTMTDRGLGERVIPIYCCEPSSIPLNFRSLAGASIHDEDLERRLQDVIGIKTVTGHAAATSTLTGASSQNPEALGGSEEGYRVEPDETGRYTQKIKPAEPSDDELNDEKRYQMNTNPKGRLFLFNMTIDRAGSEVDFDNIKHVFGEIGYEIEPHRNLKSKELERKLHKFVHQERHKDMCSVVFVLMGHGNKKGIRCRDGQIVSTRFVKDKVYEMDSMLGKPKMIFYQMCRRERNSGQGETDDDDGDDYDDESDESDESDSDLDVKNESDVLLAYATTEGHRANRGKKRGAWFIRILCKILLERAHKDDLCSMLDQVTEGVKNKRRRENRQNPVVIKQGISGKIYFLPKYPPKNESP